MREIKMWIYAIYCVGVFNACQGMFYTESNPKLSYKIETQTECRDKASMEAKQDAYKYPGKDIRWKCIDYSNVSVKEDK